MLGAVVRRARPLVPRSVLVAVSLVLVTACAGPASRPSAASGPPPGTGPGTCSASVRLDGWSDRLDKTDLAGTYVGNLSALAVVPDGLLALSDRSVLFTLDPVTRRPTTVHPLADERGAPLDSEGLVVDRDGTLLVTSEVEPSIRRYTRDGRLLGRLPVPGPLLVAPAGRAGRNLTLEGLTLSPDGRTLVASMEAALSGDPPGLVRVQTWTRDTVPPGSPAPSAPTAAGTVSSSPSAAGTVPSVPTVPTAAGSARGPVPAAATPPARPGDGGFRLAAQWALPVDPGLAVSEVAAVPDGRLLVLERGYLPGLGNLVHLALADPAGAADVSAVTDLGAGPDSRPVRTTTLADLARCPTQGATNPGPQTNPLLDNIEGMAVLGADPGGAVNLLLVSDDNQNRDEVTRLYSLSVRLPPP